MKEVTVTQYYLSQAEGRIDMDGFTRNPDLINQRQPSPRNWGLDAKVRRARLKKPATGQIHYRLELDLVISGEKADTWLAEHSRMNSIVVNAHGSKDEALNRARKDAKKKQTENRAANASKKA